MGSLQVLALVIVLVAGCDVESKAPVTPQSSSYVGGQSSCREFRSAVYSARQGKLNNAEVIERLKPIEGQGSTAEPDIRAASASLLNSAMQGDADALAEATEKMIDACTDNGY